VLCVAVLLCCVGGGEGKVISARIDTTLRRYSDVYLGAFTFDQKGGKIRVQTETKVRGQRFLFFDGSIGSWPAVLASYQDLSCAALRNVSLMVTQDEWTQSLSEGLAVPPGSYHAELALSKTPAPSQWFTMLSNCDDGINLRFTVSYLNPGGWWYEQFTKDEQGLLEMFLGWTAMYTVGCCAYAYGQYTLYRTQSLHPVCHILTAGIALELLCVLFQSLHGVQYASDGVGLEAIQGFAEVSDALSNAVIMVLLVLLAKGWTTSTGGAARPAPDLENGQIASLGAMVLGFFSLYVIELMGRALDQRYCYDSDLGVFGLVLRTWVCVYFVLCISHTRNAEDSPKRREFLSWFGVAGVVWFTALPAAYFAAQFLDTWHQMRLVVSVGVTFHTLGLVGLVALTWPRNKSEYLTLVAEDVVSGTTPYDEI